MLNSAISNRWITFPDKMVEMPEQCCIIFTSNTNGNGATAHYSAREKLDLATKKRCFLIFVDYDKDLEKRIIGDEHSAFGVSLHDFRTKIESLGIRDIMVTTRDFVNARKMLDSKTYTHEEILEGLIWQGATVDTIKKVRGY
jgi:hypothetical protein